VHDAWHVEEAVPPPNNPPSTPPGPKVKQQTSPLGQPDEAVHEREAPPWHIPLTVHVGVAPRPPTARGAQHTCVDALHVAPPQAMVPPLDPELPLPLLLLLEEAPLDPELAPDDDPEPPLLDPELAPDEEPELPLPDPEPPLDVDPLPSSEPDSRDASSDPTPGMSGAPSSSGPRAPHAPHARRRTTAIVDSGLETFILFGTS
jgi:hypothetical protein